MGCYLFSRFPDLVKNLLDIKKPSLFVFFIMSLPWGPGIAPLNAVNTNKKSCTAEVVAGNISTVEGGTEHFVVMP